MDIFVKLAKVTIEKYITSHKLPDPKNQPVELLNKKAGCFVSLHNKNDGELRGCIGTIIPVYKNIASEIIHNAVEASVHDPRFSPITKNDLDNLEISVDVLGEPEAINSEKSLDPKKYGVIVKSHDGRTGLLLPDLEGIDDTSYQVAIAKEKAGIAPNEDVFLYRFTVKRHEEN